METVVSQGTSRLEAIRRYRRMYKLEDEAMEDVSDIPAHEEDEAIANKRTSAKKAKTKSNNSGIRLDASFPAQVDFDHPYRQLLMAVKTKPFLLIRGVCGSGKSRFARALAYQTCPSHLQENRKPGNFQLLAVQPSWHDNKEILGWTNSYDIFQITPFLHFLIKAWRHPEVPFILCLDEMNLARMEDYFADFLSILESRQFINGKLVSDPFISGVKLKTLLESDPGIWKRLELSINHDLKQFFLSNGIMFPPNLIVIGTANVDKSRHPFSMNALDRTMVIELNGIDFYGGIKAPGTELDFPDVPLDNDYLFGDFLQGREAYLSFPLNGDFIVAELYAIDTILSESPYRFGYRVRDDALIYCAHNAKLNANKGNNEWVLTCLDEIILMKVLPRINGSYKSSEKVINGLLRFTKNRYHRSFKRLTYMKNKAEGTDSFSFWR